MSYICVESTTSDYSYVPSMGSIELNIKEFKTKKEALDFMLEACKEFYFKDDWVGEENWSEVLEELSNNNIYESDHFIIDDNSAYIKLDNGTEGNWLIYETHL